MVKFLDQTAGQAHFYNHLISKVHKNLAVLSFYNGYSGGWRLKTCNATDLSTIEEVCMGKQFQRISASDEFIYAFDGNLIHVFNWRLQPVKSMGQSVDDACPFYFPNSGIKQLEVC